MGRFCYISIGVEIRRQKESSRKNFVVSLHEIC